MTIPTDLAATRILIRSLSFEELQQWLLEAGQPAFRARQIWQWIWQKNARSFEGMANLPKKLREQLHDHFSFDAVCIQDQQHSLDGTIKLGFQLYDAHITEGVLIPSPQRDRMTACISSQVGCSLSCSFCATGRLARKRNLSAGEIVDQVVLIDQLARTHYNRPLSNIVFMGMGEPLLNYREVRRGIDRLTAEDGLGLSPRRITVSTAGIAKMIEKLGDDEVRFHLALSLHAADESKRSQIMPINESNSLEALSGALMHFYRQTGQRIYYEYIVLHHFNDTEADARSLAQFARITPCKINLIEYNPIEGGAFQKASQQRTDQFASWLRSRYNLVVNIRRSRGEDIDAACGQLANKKHQAQVE